MQKTMRGLTLAIALLCALTLAACEMLDPSPDAEILEPELVDCDSPTTLDGLELYRCECASCHGVDGIPEASSITDIRGFSSRVAYQRSLNIGPGGMPRYPELDDEMRDRLFLYVKDNLGR